MIVDKVWKLTNVVRVGLALRSSHSCSVDFKSFYIQPTEGEVNYEDGTAQHRNDQRSGRPLRR
jgi:hypothetical protein